mmetsp:Transcript_17371/g.43274  ORF Transcript_17371/g.43274 Transcript_17371/m.43274 type:complete len:149 (-) Transcript_17371:296-742(-)
MAVAVRQAEDAVSLFLTRSYSATFSEKRPLEEKLSQLRESVATLRQLNSGFDHIIACIQQPATSNVLHVDRSRKSEVLQAWNLISHRHEEAQRVLGSLEWSHNAHLSTADVVRLPKDLAGVLAIYHRYYDALSNLRKKYLQAFPGVST